jgi:multiple sugar transport system ATP-binding protein
MTSVRISKLRKVFADGTVGLHDFSLDIADREFLTFLGPSGCGKTTTLRMIAGLEHPTAGEIHFGDRRVDVLTPAERDVAMVFQSYALYPHMTVRQNLEYPLRKRKVAVAERGPRVAAVAAMLKIESLLDRRPRQLSGGQQQRVALGRAVVRDAAALLLDEPLSNLDAELRAHMRTELVQLHRTLGRTMLYVTHDQIEAMTMSTRIAVLSQGRLQQVATPDDVYRRPANRFVATFVGSPAMNFLEGELIREDGRLLHRSAQMTIDLPPGRAAELGGRDWKRLSAGFRAEDASIVPAQGGTQANATVTVVERTGHEALVWLEAAGARLVARAAADIAVKAGDPVLLVPRPEKIHLFDAESGERVIGSC